MASYQPGGESQAVPQPAEIWRGIVRRRPSIPAFRAASLKEKASETLSKETIVCNWWDTMSQCMQNARGGLGGRKACRPVRGKGWKLFYAFNVIV